MKTKTLSLLLVAGLAIVPVWAQSNRAMPVGKVQVKTYQTAARAGARLESAWARSPQETELAPLLSDLQATLVSVRGSDRTEADRLFVKALGYGADIFAAGALVRAAVLDETKRSAASDVAKKFGVDTLEWSDDDKWKLLYEDGGAFLRAAQHFYAGRTGDGLSTEELLFERIADRRASALAREKP